MVTTTMQLLGGWSIGYDFARKKGKEDEVKQGKNYYFSSLAQVGQIAAFSSVVSTVAERLFQGYTVTTAKIAVNIAPFVAFPAYLLMASVQHNDYARIAGEINRRLPTGFPVALPLHLSAHSIRAISYITEKTGDVLRIAMIAGGVALCFLGRPYYGGALLVALGYDVVDRLGFVPRKISLFMEINMPSVAIAGSFIAGTLFTRIVTGAMLAMQCIPAKSYWLQHKLDALVRHFFELQGPSLEEIESPLKEQKELSYDSIVDIIKGDNSSYEINPAHCSSAVLGELSIADERTFDDFLTLFDQTNWEEKYPLVLKKIGYDERFVGFLKTQFVGIDETILKKDADKYVGMLATQEGISKERYAANWMRQQLVQLVKVLKGEVRVDGMQQDLDDTLPLMGRILAKLKTVSDTQSREDILLKVAVEAGNYCSRGIKRVAGELITQMMFGGVNDLDPVKEYELKVRHALQEMRYETIQMAYQTIVEMILAKAPDSVKFDIHSFDIYRTYLSLGIYPVTEHERQKVGLAELIVWYTYEPLREQVYKVYSRQIKGVIQKLGRADFNIYLEKMLSGNPRLSEDERERLIQLFQDANEGAWSVDETYKRFGRFMFVALGILRLKK